MTTVFLKRKENFDGKLENINGLDCHVDVNHYWTVKDGDNGYCLFSANYHDKKEDILQTIKKWLNNKIIFSDKTRIFRRKSDWKNDFAIFDETIKTTIDNKIVYFCFFISQNTNTKQFEEGSSIWFFPMTEHYDNFYDEIQNDKDEIIKRLEKPVSRSCKTGNERPLTSGNEEIFDDELKAKIYQEYNDYFLNQNFISRVLNR